MVKKMKKIIINIMIVVDHFIFLLVFPFCLIGLLFAIPWILKQRRIWQYSAKGSRKAVILREFKIEKVMKRGYELLLPYKNPNINVKISDDFDLIAWQSPKLVNILEKAGFFGTSIIFRELIAIFRVTNFCVKERIGLIRAYNFTYAGLQAYLVSSFIKIPYMVDVAGNLELIYRLTGKSLYFKTLNRTPIIRIFARIATNWLLGLPLRHAFRVVGRDKCTFEYARSLGAPVERLSFLRISNFSAAFNSYNPEKPPAKPAEYPYLLLVGRLAKIHFPLDVLDAFDQAAPQLPEYRLVIIGDGPIRNDVEQRRERSEYKDRIPVILKWSSMTIPAILCLFEILKRWRRR
jgi:glycosyltransferase involved in cell wall biosynthesis